LEEVVGPFVRTLRERRWDVDAPERRRERLPHGGRVECWERGDDVRQVLIQALGRHVLEERAAEQREPELGLHSQPREAVREGEPRQHALLEGGFAGEEAQVMTLLALVDLHNLDVAEERLERRLNLLEERRRI